MCANLALAKAGRAAFAASFVLAFGAMAAAPAHAQNPCKSEDPADLDEAIRRADCGDADKEGWGTRDFDREMDRIPDGDGSATGSGQEADYSFLPTSFSAWFDSLSQSDKRQFAVGIAREAEIGGADMSAEELDALMVLLRSEIDSYFDSQDLSADQRRKAIAEIAKEVGVGLEPKRASSGAENEDFGDELGAGYDEGFRDESGADGLGSGYDGWEPMDPTEGFGRPSDGEPNSELDPQGF